MKLRENPSMGRKVFFINPPFKVGTLIIPELRRKEYEIYELKNYQHTKNILRLFPESICFLNIDEVLTPTEWFNFVRSFDNDDKLKTIHLGVLSMQSLTWVKELFLIHTNMPCGFIPITASKAQLTETFTAILDMNGAKGKRKYVRADCEQDDKIIANCIVSGIEVKLKIRNISTVGLCCTAPLASHKLFQINLVVRRFVLIIHDKEIVTNAAVIAVKIEGDHLMLVLLFLQGISFTAKEHIRNYVTAFLERSIHIISQNIPLDTTDYSILPKEEIDEVKALEELKEINIEEDASPTVFDTKDLNTTQLF
jgi:hypothetical protein